MGSAMHMRARLILAGLIVASALVATAQETPVPQFYQLLPLDYPYNLIRVCSTQWGLCAIPSTVMPGTPCYCQASDGAWLPGVCMR
jgi:hypothetical protein